MSIDFQDGGDGHSGVMILQIRTPIQSYVSSSFSGPYSLPGPYSVKSLVDFPVGIGP